MKTKLLSIASALLASGLATTFSYVLGARGETLQIIAVVTVAVSCTTAFTAASIAMRPRKKSG
jgi:hypothetical protein